MKKNKSCVILSPTAILGYGFPESSFIRGLEYGPDVIAVDAGSTDPGPYYLGAGKPFTNRNGVKRDLTYMIRAGLEHHIPVIIGTAGGSGARAHVDWCEQIIREIVTSYGLSCKMGIIYADIAPDYVRQELTDGRIRPLTCVDELSIEMIDASSNIVAQMGYEPIIEALNRGCDVILAGRAYDPACFAALPVSRGFDPGLALHAGKILECAAIAATPGSGSDCVLGIIEEDHFTVRTLNDERRFTEESTCAHTLYEKSDPYHLPGPGGVLNLDDTRFVETEEGVEVYGTRFEPSDDYTIKLEGARPVGYRTISIAATRDPVMIGQLDTIIPEAERRVAQLVPEMYARTQVCVHQYGRHGVMGPSEPTPDLVGHEVALLIDVVGEQQQDADTVCSLMRSTLLHFGYPGRISTAGNLAFPFSPSDITAGQVYEFSIYHLLSIDPDQIPMLFPVKEVLL